MTALDPVRLIAEDFVREERGQPPLCGRCRGEILGGRTAVFRCTECQVPFHRKCAIRHFAESGGGPHGPPDTDPFATALAIRDAVDELRRLP